MEHREEPKSAAPAREQSPKPESGRDQDELEGREKPKTPAPIWEQDKQSGSAPDSSKKAPQGDEPTLTPKASASDEAAAGR